MKDCLRTNTVKEKYFKNMTGKLGNSLTAPKGYWSILNNFLGKSKIYYIPLYFKYLVDSKCPYGFILSMGTSVENVIRS